jgi:hypothetical protein
VAFGHRPVPEAFDVQNFDGWEGTVNAPDTRRRLPPALKPPRSKKARQSKAFVAELRRQCRLIAAADRRDKSWQQLVLLPG